MEQIRAFVGHSFSEEDAEVVDKFLKYFAQLQRAHPTFSWQNAESAEPKVLAEKVLSLFADKNVFIGICTKKERVINPTLLKKAWLSAGSLKASSEKFEWKTSDWIIQEIGLARGRNMDLVLLIEDGLRQPGGLQGNMNYIPFDRNAPEKSFGKIVEMIGALSPKTTSLSSGEAVTAPPVSEEGKENAARRDDKFSTPLPTWEWKDYEFALFRATILGETATAEKLHSAYLETQSGSHPDNAESWRALGVYVRLAHGQGASLAELKEIARRSPDNSAVLGYLGRAYEHYEQYDDAAVVFKDASSKSKDVPAKLKLLRQAAAASQKVGKFDFVAEILSSMRALSTKEGIGEAEVLAALKDSATASDDDELFLATLERAVDLEPDNEDYRFALAYKYSQLGNQEMALFHYLRIPERERKEGTWNNIGVALDHLQLAVKSVDAYRSAENMGHTLAMANLAQKLINAGFLDEADEICKRALKIEGFHKNVGHAISRMRELPAEEDKKEQDTLDKARPTSEFYRSFGRAAAKPEPASLSGTWQGPDSLLNVSFSQSKLICVGEYEKEAGMGLLGLARRGLLSEPPPVERFRVEYVAHARGRAFVGKVTKKSAGAPTGIASYLLASTDAEIKVLIVLSDDGQQLDVMEMAEGKDVRRYKLQRIDG